MVAGARLVDDALQGYGRADLWTEADYLNAAGIRLELVERTTTLDLMDGPERILFEVFAEYERRERRRLRRAIVRHSDGAEAD